LRRLYGSYGDYGKAQDDKNATATTGVEAYGAQMSPGAGTEPDYSDGEADGVQTTPGSSAEPDDADSADNADYAASVKASQATAYTDRFCPQTCLNRRLSRRRRSECVSDR